MKHGVVIVGGGIAGSALSIALTRRGIKTTLVEREAHWAPLSSGLFIYSNGLLALDRLGVLDAICGNGWVSPDGGNLYLTADGKDITRTIYPRIGERIPAIVGMWRAELHRVLSTELERLGVTVRLGVTPVEIDDRDAMRPVSVTLSDGTSLSCDVLVGADGIRSVTRTHLFGAIEPAYTGFGVWRSTHRKPKNIDQKIMLMGVGTRLGIMPISHDELYMFGTTREPGKPFYARDRWAAEMRRKFSGFAGPAAPLLAEITDASQVFYTSVEEVHLPLPWSRGRAVLIGDAAHSSSPFMGQGGAMALEDALVLAAILGEATDIPAALTAFGAQRFERCKFVQDASRRVGEAGATEDAAASIRRNERMRSAAQQDVNDFYARMAEPIMPSTNVHHSVQQGEPVI
ncbi:MAG: FAD-dependent monooxygenase [Pseudolabrys sp.]|jgi:2-polyprenyl-6-methoxyphenol hydroxylase-like FAD-dependent oxidoreductase